MAEPADRGREETEHERADRRYVELLQELRVAQTGVQFLFGFLLAIAFAPGFDNVTDAQRNLYVGVLVVTATASALLIGPVPFHRILFRRGLKPQIVSGASHMALGGLAMLLLAINGAVLLVLDVVLGGWPAALLTALITTWFLAIWVVIPIRARGRKDDAS